MNHCFGEVELLGDLCHSETGMVSVGKQAQDVGSALYCGDRSFTGLGRHVVLLLALRRSMLRGSPDRRSGTL